MNKKWFASKHAFKVYSLLIAIFLWVFVIYDQDPESTKTFRNIPVYYNNLSFLEDKNLTVYEEEPLYVDFTVRGKRSVLSKLSKDSVRAAITFSETREGTHTVTVDALLPQSDLSVSKKSPSTIDIKVESLKKDQPFNIGITYSGTNTDGKLASAELKTDTVYVSGPASALNRIKSAKISVDYATVMNNETGTSIIHLYDHNGNDITSDRNIHLSSDKVSWSRKVYTVKDVSVDMVFATNSYAVDDLKIAESEIKLSCDDGKALQFDSVKTKPVSAADVKKLENGESIEVALDLESYVNVLRQDEYGRWKLDESNIIRIEGKIMHLEKLPVNESKIEITDTSADKTYRIKGMPDHIFVKCRDGYSADALWNTTFKVSAKDLSEGEHKAEIFADLPENTSLAEKYEIILVVDKINR